jgi:hypothetical protein
MSISFNPSAFGSPVGLVDAAGVAAQSSRKMRVLVGLGSLLGEEKPLRGEASFRGEVSLRGERDVGGLGSGRPRRRARRESWSAVRGRVVG